MTWEELIAEGLTGRYAEIQQDGRTYGGPLETVEVLEDIVLLDFLWVARLSYHGGNSEHWESWPLKDFCAKNGSIWLRNLKNGHVLFALDNDGSGKILPPGTVYPDPHEVVRLDQKFVLPKVPAVQKNSQTRMRHKSIGV